MRFPVVALVPLLLLLAPGLATNLALAGEPQGRSAAGSHADSHGESRGNSRGESRADSHGGESSPYTRVSVLSWLAGRWRGDADSTRLEEHWSAPAGDCMMGMFRAVRSGHVRAYQFMSLEQDPEGVLLRVKRFDPGLVGKEDRDRAVVFRLERVTGREAIFDYEGPESPKRLTYRRAGHDSLYVRLERIQGGEHGVMNFRFVRLSSE